jgi:hypothetical protein
VSGRGSWRSAQLRERAVQGTEAGGGSDGSTQEAGALGRCIR